MSRSTQFRLYLGALAVALLAALPPAWAEAPSAAFSSGDCVDCHDPEEADPETGSSIGAVTESVHEFAECLDCHPGAEFEEHVDGGLIPGCGDCHDDAVAELDVSVHGGEAGAAVWAEGGCQSCHGAIHALVPQTNELSPIHPTRVAETCGSCHGDAELRGAAGIRLVQPLAAYTASVHARALAEGTDGAVCSDCHGAHEILPAGDAGSAVHRGNVVQTCATCHGEIAEVFASSVHGKAAAHGIQDSPVCTDCHGEHRILGPQHEDSPVYATNIPKLTCGRCHGDLRLSSKFGIAADKVPAYADSFHGLASRSGSVTVANCASCHGVHDIVPSTDPSAHTHADNLAATCGNCHPGAGNRYAIGPVHVLPTAREHAAVYWVRKIYLALIFATIGAMLLHNGLDLYRKAGRRRRPKRRHVARLERMPAGFRLAHALLAVSFMVLAYSGFALKYPEAWWAAPLLQWESSFGLRGWVHRLAALVMLAAAALHLVHLAVDRRARRAITAMMPSRSDWREFVHKVRWLVGRDRVEPSEPWLSYTEKAEYLAVVWGSAIMAVTGFLLWFEELTLRWLPAWVPDVATVIHFYEAILATFAILVWHLYSVIFDPDVYPMDRAWWTGRSERPRELPVREVRSKKKS